jgi:hypothetical protein
MGVDALTAQTQPEDWRRDARAWVVMGLYADEIESMRQWLRENASLLSQYSNGNQLQ